MKLLSAHEELVGTPKNDVLVGINPTSAFFFGGFGDDVLIYDGVGSATLNGGAGRDVLIGGSGSNFLDGGSGDDILVGGAESDIFIGGPGRDQFVLRVGSRTDFIEDFRHGDKIRLHGLHFTDLLIDNANGVIFDNRAHAENPPIIAILNPHVGLTLHDFLFI